ncbi:MAG: hypothetical protein ABW221_02070 [Vicinamibacteria bacterium]
MTRVFLLSPASTAGRRAQILVRPEAGFDLARRVRDGGAPLGEVFAFLSGLYFRGKLTYANAFAPAGGVFVITSSDGLVPPERVVGLADLQRFASVPIEAQEARYRLPLLRDVQALAETAPDAEVVLLGSIATDKYVEPLRTAFGGRLRFPSEFAGRGDMSRGGLLLRCVEDGRELTYVGLEAGARHGARPERLTPRPPVRRPGPG